MSAGKRTGEEVLFWKLRHVPECLCEWVHVQNNTEKFSIYILMSQCVCVCVRPLRQDEDDVSKNTASVFSE